MSVLATLVGVDLSVSGRTVFFAVPAGKVAVITAVNVRNSATYTGSGNEQIAPYSEVNAGNLWSSPTAVFSAIPGGFSFTTPPNSSGQVGQGLLSAPGDVIDLAILTPDTGVDCTADVDLIGYLV